MAANQLIQTRIDGAIREEAAAVLASLGLRDHALTGDWRDHRDCHVRPDLLLIRKPDAGALELVRLGSHSELGR